MFTFFPREKFFSLDSFIFDVIFCGYGSGNTSNMTLSKFLAAALKENILRRRGWMTALVGVHSVPFAVADPYP